MLFIHLFQFFSVKTNVEKVSNRKSMPRTLPSATVSDDHQPVQDSLIEFRTCDTCAASCACGTPLNAYNNVHTMTKIWQQN